MILQEVAVVYKRRRKAKTVFAAVLIAILASISQFSACASGGSDNGGSEAVYESSDPVNTELIRNFKLPIPLFSSESAWRQKASSAAVLSNSEAIIAYTYSVLTGNEAGLVSTNAVNFPFIHLNYDEYTVPLFLAGSGTSDVLLCQYDGERQWPNEKFGGDLDIGGPVSIPTPAGTIRPAEPVGTDSDGWLTLYHPGAGMVYDFRQATTQRNGECQSLGAGYEGDSLIEAGYADFLISNGSTSDFDIVTGASR